MLTVDALLDARFRSNTSVHAMRLRSVISVPIRSPEGVLGALYLDNRFEKGRFREQHQALLLAFADQASIALETARLIEDLEWKTTELEKEHKRVEAMVESQARQIDRLSEDLRVRQQALEHKYDYSQIVGRSPKMSELLNTLDRVIDTNLPVLIQGESGTGKELVARSIHWNGPRKDRPFVSVNCGALSETLLESELFGHVKGAFTGAVNDRAGLLVEAAGGTLFLDEVGEMPAGMQVKLLRALQEQEVRPVGSGEVIPIDVRLLAATNRRLKDEVREGRFRQDLYYRIVVVEVTIPPLRERVEDIPPLVQHVLAELSVELHRPTPEITTETLRVLTRFQWPGNVRQLRNVLSKATVLADGTIEPGDIELSEGQPHPIVQAQTRKDFEAEEAARILAALQANGWNVSEVARAFGIARTTLYRKLRRHGLFKSDKTY